MAHTASEKGPATPAVVLVSLLLVLAAGADLRGPVAQAMERGIGMRNRGTGGPLIRDPGMDAPPPPRQEQVYRSPFDLTFSPDGRRLAVSDRTAGNLCLFDARTGDLAQIIKLRGRPSGLAWNSAEKVVVCEYDAGSVVETDARTGQILRRFFVGPKPIGVATAPKRGLLVICDFGLHTVSTVDMKSGSQSAPIPAGRHPHSVAITPDERIAVVANLLPSGSAAEHTSASVVTLIDLDRAEKIADIPLPDNSSAVRQVRVSPDGRWAYIAHTRGRTMLPTTQLDRGWINTNALSIIDLAAAQSKDAAPAWRGRPALASRGHLGLAETSDPATQHNEPRLRAMPYATVLLDTVAEGAGDPWGIALSPDGATAWITIAGGHEIARIELGRLHDLLAECVEGVPPSNRGQDARDTGYAHVSPAGVTSDAGAIWRQIREDPGKRDGLSHHLSALYAAELMTRVPIAAKGPRAIAIAPDGGQLMVASYYSGEVLALDPNNCRVVKRIGLGHQPAPDAVRHGEFVFHDARHSFQHWLSCATCHPDGRADGMNWDLLNDGLGNPKNAHSLLWAHRTPPLMSLGIREDMELATQKGFQFVQFREIDADDLNAVRAYLRALEPEPSPHLINGELSAKARRGKQIFEDAEVGCSACHPTPLFTSLKTHDVGTRSALDRTGAFDTPTCVELWRTAPYLHDGSAVTLKEVVTTKNPEDKHGRTSHLNQDDIDALVEYLLSL